MEKGQDARSCCGFLRGSHWDQIHPGSLGRSKPGVMAAAAAAAARWLQRESKIHVMVKIDHCFLFSRIRGFPIRFFVLVSGSIGQV